MVTQHSKDPQSIGLRSSLIQTLESLHRIHRLVGTILDSHPILFTHIMLRGIILLSQKSANPIHEREQIVILSKRKDSFVETS